MFPSGRPGTGLLLLRTAAGITFVIQGIANLVGGTDVGLMTRAIGLVAVVAGVLLLIGFVTPITSIVVGLVEIAGLLSWLPPSFNNLGNNKLSMIFMMVIAAAVFLLGPGEFSIDARLFGRREIIIPPITRIRPM